MARTCDECAIARKLDSIAREIGYNAMAVGSRPSARGTPCQGTNTFGHLAPFSIRRYLHINSIPLLFLFFGGVVDRGDSAHL